MTEKALFPAARAALHRLPQAAARVQGSKDYSAISGWVRFYPLGQGVLVAADVAGLPQGILGFHIHSGARCGGTTAAPFADTLTHYNPDNAAHPNHAGDMPPLFSNHGHAFQAFYTDRFTVEQVLGRTVVIHAGPDDFTSQPAGNAGQKIACGVITPVARR